MSVCGLHPVLIFKTTISSPVGSALII